MSSNKKLMTLLFAGILFNACQTAMKIPIAYNFTVKESRGNPYGCWTILNLKDEQNALVPDSIAGELLCMDTDTLYLLISDSIVWPVYSGSILKAQLYTHKNQAGTYSAMTSLFIFPSLIGSLIVTGEYAGGMLILGIPMAAVGLTHILIEGSAHRNILIYPEKNTLNNFKLESTPKSVCVFN